MQTDDGLNLPIPTRGPAEAPFARDQHDRGVLLQPVRPVRPHL